MKTKAVLILLTLCFLLSLSNAWAGDAQNLAGNYELTGIHEMAGMLQLKPSQKYEAGFSYGAGDWVEEGTWKAEGNVVVLSGGRFKMKNSKDDPLILISGTRLSYKDGKLANMDPQRPIAFVDPHKTPSNRKKTGEAGEGRMLVQGRVVKIDSDTMVVKVKGECIDFSVPALSQDVLKMAKKGANLDTEIPYSSIIGGETCPTQ